MDGQSSRIITVENLSKKYRVQGKNINAVSNITLEIMEGEVFGLIGKSGSGKSTLAKCISGIIKPSGGTILYGEGIKDHKKSVQYIFQDCAAAMNPRFCVKQILEEPLKIHRIYKSEEEFMKKAIELLEFTGLTKDILDRYPNELSGGQNQRVCIARALIVNPQVLIADEPAAALDIKTRIKVMSLFEKMREKYNMTIVLISHDFEMIETISTRIGVVSKGEIIEVGNSVIHLGKLIE